MKYSTLVLCVLLAACGSSSDGSTPDPAPPAACSPEALDGYCDPAVNDLGQTMACEHGECAPTWDGKCSPELLNGSCYDPAFPIPPEPAGFGLSCCDGRCVRGRGCP